MAIGSTDEQPRLEVLSQKMEKTVVKTGGEDDYAYKYTDIVRNKGGAGKVRGMARVYAKEETLYREKVVSLKADEQAKFEFIFTEPLFLVEMLTEERKQYDFSYDVVK